MTAAAALDHDALLRPAPPQTAAGSRCACGGLIAGGGECEQCRRRRLATPPVVRSALEQRGEGLDAGVRRQHETRLGRDLSAVRVHADDQSAHAADALGARAFALSNHIVFGRGEHAPHSPPGRELLAHELAHTIQQEDAPPAAALAKGPLRIGDAAAEREVRSAGRLSARAPALALAPEKPAAPPPPAGTANDRIVYGEIGEYAITSLQDHSAPASLGDAKASVIAACARSGGRCVPRDGTKATEPGDTAAWANIVAASGADQSGGGNRMCVGTEECQVVHSCTGCTDGKKAVRERATPLKATGTVTLERGTVYFYNSPFDDWCSAPERNSGCKPKPKAKAKAAPMKAAPKAKPPAKPAPKAATHGALAAPDDMAALATFDEELLDDDEELA